MNRSAPLLTEEFEKALDVIRTASIAILSLLEVDETEAKGPQWFLQQLEQARLNLGNWAAVARRLNLNDAEMTQFTLQLRHLQQLAPEYERGQEVNQNQHIAALRFVAVLEQVREKQPLLHYSTSMMATDPEQQQHGMQQLRALELMLKGLIASAWPNQQQLLNHLKTRFGAEKVRHWLKMGETGDVLSGLRFSELALLVLDKKEFARHYQKLFHSAPSLTLYPEPRKTLHLFLDDIRAARRRIIAGGELSTGQLLLLNNLYSAVTQPVQKAWGKGQCAVNPQALLALDTAQLPAFFAHAARKNSESDDDSQQLRDNIERPAKQRRAASSKSRQLVASMVWGVVGLAFIGLLAGGLFIVNDIRKASHAKQATPVVSGTFAHLNENEGNSPRERLSKLGIGWDENNLHSAIDRNDVAVVKLFLAAGMNWKVSWTDKALAADYEDSLSLLLKYGLQMNENKPCRRFIPIVAHALQNGEKLTAMRKQFLKSFCSRPAVIKRQQYDVDQAMLRAQANPNRQNQRWVDIQQQIYRIIR